MIKTIFFATDFSPASRKALQAAVGIAKRFDARLVGVHALKTPSVLYGASSKDVESWRHDNEVRLNSFLSGPEADGFKIESRVIRGPAEEVLSDLAKREKADLIIVCKHSRSTLEKFFVGSVAERVAARAPCPVLVVPPTPTSLYWRHLIASTDFSHNSRKAVQFAVRLSRKRDFNLALLHVLPGTRRGATDESRAREAGEAMARLEAEISKYGAPAGTQCFVLRGHPAKALAEKAEELDAGLLVVGRHGLTEGDYVGLGSTTLALLETIERPILIVP